jgi:hypothetical protein
LFGFVFVPISFLTVNAIDGSNIMGE